MAFPNALHHSLHGHFDLVVESRADLGVSGAARPTADGRDPRFPNLSEPSSEPSFASARPFRPKICAAAPHQRLDAATCAQLNQRDRLAAWLAAPEDLLPSLWSSPIGEATKEMIRSLKSDTVFAPEQVSLRNSIGERLSQVCKPMAIQLLLVNFLYSPPGLLKIANAEEQLPVVAC